MFVYFRKRLWKKAICQIIEAVNQKARVAEKRIKDSDKGDGGGYSSGKESNQGISCKGIWFQDLSKFG